MDKILNTPIKELPTSDEFQDICTQNSFSTLLDILNVAIEDLEYEYGFSKRMIFEFYGFVKKYGLEEMVKEGDW